MNYIDIIIILLFIGALIRGISIGSIRQISSTLGFLAGLFLGALIGSHLLHFAHSTASRSWINLLFTFGIALVGLVVAEYFGGILKLRLVPHHLIDRFDVIIGGAIGVLTVIVLLWLSASTLETLPYPSLTYSLRGSYLIGEINKILPPPPNIVGDISHLIAPNGFPKVFIGSEPAPINPNIALPDLGTLAPAVNRDKMSVVRVEGVGCGGIVEGSGFVVAPNTVMTNAHVVSGLKTPYIVDQNGQHNVRVIDFDPNLDLAILSTSDLAGKPLPVITSIAKDSTPSAVIGYPGGGELSASGAVVLASFTATGQNIYDQGSVDRSILEVKAKVIPGNSGGPLINSSGDVIGVIFAESTDYNDVGYALTLKQPIQELNQALRQNQTVSTGTCAE